jgi:hypothetical protein
MTTLFELPPTVEAAKPSKLTLLQQMHAKHGTTEGKTCGNCIFLRGYTQSRTWWKCTQAHLSHSASSDWRKKWLACGLYREADE